MNKKNLAPTLVAFISTLTLSITSFSQVIGVPPENEIGQKGDLPSNIYLLDGEFSQHVAIAEKATHTLHLYKNMKGSPKHIKSYPMATGKTAGNKINQGDLKTPEGIYLLTSFLNQKQLFDRYGQEAKMYGTGAFVLNYPNVMDERAQKTGSGIWLHSTDDESRISKGLDSKGCLVIANQDLRDISQYIDLQNTPVIIVQELYFLRKETWETNRNTIVNTVNEWVNSWKNEDLNSYIDFYHPTEFKDSSKKNRDHLKAYKRSVFQQPGKPQINISNISILSNNDYTVVQFQQNYASASINDTGKKTVFLKRDHNYKWKIVAEVFSRIPEKGQIAFSQAPQLYSENSERKAATNSNVKIRQDI
jgi:murein L,D-transpeptidase YafK